MNSSFRWIIFAAGSSLFGAAWFTFNFPLTFCDSPRWGSGYFSRLVHSTAVFNDPEGWLVPAYYDFLGRISISLRAGNLIGFTQGLFVSVALLWLLFRLLTGKRAADWVLLPGILMSFLRHAVYSQTIMSESLTILLYVPIMIFLIRDRVRFFGLVVAAVLAGFLLNVRTDSGYLIPLIFLKFVSNREKEGRDIPRLIGRFVMLFAVVFLVVKATAPRAEGAYGRGHFMTFSEWVRYTKPPQNCLARKAHFPLVDWVVLDVQGNRPLSIWQGLRYFSYFQSYPEPSLVALAKLIVYQTVNQPSWVLRERLAAFADYFSTTYAAFWPDYHGWSRFYGPYDNVFARWTVEDMNKAGHWGCPHFAKALSAHFGLPVIRSSLAFNVLKWLHQFSRYYAALVLRPLAWTALLMCGCIFLGGRATSEYLWTTLILFSHLLFRAVLTCVDERYQLQADLLMVCWISLSLQMGLRGFRLPLRVEWRGWRAPAG